MFNDILYLVIKSVQNKCMIFFEINKSELHRSQNQKSMYVCISKY